MSVIINQDSTAPRRRRGAAQKNANAPQGSTQKKKSPTQKKQRRRPRSRNTTGATGSSAIKVLPCTINYAKCLADPWDTYSMPSDICLPDDTDIPSFKFRVRLRGTLSTSSTTGSGFIMISPLGFGNSAIQSVGYSTSTYAGNGFPTVGAVTGVQYMASGAPFGSSVGTCPKFRCVAMGLRVRYTGPESTRGGTVLPFRARVLDADTVSSQTQSMLSTSNQSSIEPVKRKWIGTVWTPIVGFDRTYQKVTASAHGVDTVASARPIGISIEGPAGNTYQWDAVGYYEAIAQEQSGVTYGVPSLSSSDSDLMGLSFVKDVYAKVSDSTIGQAMMDMFINAAKTYVSAEVPFVAPALGWIM